MKPQDKPADGTPDTQRMEVTGGRDEIDKFGDTSVGDVLRRPPGVTVPGAPGRSGAPRMRGLGNGCTQILIDGEHIPAGFSLESLTPEQVERIEIVRAPAAETGARVIAGTIVTREKAFGAGAAIGAWAWRPRTANARQASTGPSTCGRLGPAKPSRVAERGRDHRQRPRLG